MTDYPRRQHGRECDEPEKPATQPKPPATGCDCPELPTTEPPTLEEPKPCPPPDPHCKCPTPPRSTSNCLQKLIDEQSKEITTADKAKAFKADLETLLAKAKTAEQEYTRDEYTKLVKQWKTQDEALARLLQKLVCALPCWRCILECYVCPLLNELHTAEQWLYGDGEICADVHNLYDVRYWYERDKDTKQRQFDRIKLALSVWEMPAQTIKKVLADEAAFLEKWCLGADAAKSVYDLFLKIIPLHLAIAPPQGSQWTTQIGAEYTEFCCCDKGVPDDCCGPDVGQWSLRQRLIGPQPYLIDPCDYYKLLCCLIENRYEPAKSALAAAEAAYQAADNELNRRKTQIDSGLKSFEKDAKAAIPGTIECCHEDLPQIKSPDANAKTN